MFRPSVRRITKARSKRGIPLESGAPAASGGATPPSATEKSTIRKRFLRAPVIIGTAFLAAVGSFLVTQFAPGVLEAVQGKEPINVIVGSVLNETKSGQKGSVWTINTPNKINPADAPPPGSSCDDAKSWLTRLGGASVGTTGLTMLVEGQRSSGVTIKSMQARVLERAKPFTGAQVVCPSAGNQNAVGVGFDLDSPTPVARVLKKIYPLELGEPYFDNYFITLASGEPLAFHITGTTAKSFVRWVIDITIVVDGKERTVTVGGDGFKTTGAAEVSEHWEWNWDAKPQRLVQDIPCTFDPSVYCGSK